MRNLLGKRNPGHSLSRMLAPCNAAAFLRSMCSAAHDEKCCRPSPFTAQVSMRCSSCRPIVNDAELLSIAKELANDDTGLRQSPSRWSILKSHWREQTSPWAVMDSNNFSFFRSLGPLIAGSSSLSFQGGQRSATAPRDVELAEVPLCRLCI